MVIKQTPEELMMKALWVLKLKWMEPMKGKFVSLKWKMEGYVLEYPKDSAFYEYVFCPEEKLAEFYEAKQPFDGFPEYLVSGAAVDIESMSLAEQEFKRPIRKYNDHE